MEKDIIDAEVVENKSSEKEPSFKDFLFKRCGLKNKKEKKIELIKDLIFSTSLFLVVATYVITNIFIGLWHPMWVLFFLPFIIADLYEAIARKEFNELPLVFIATFVYLTTCLFLMRDGIMLWHPMWVVYLIVPLYSAIKKFIKTIKKIKECD